MMEWSAVYNIRQEKVSANIEGETSHYTGVKEGMLNSN